MFKKNWMNRKEKRTDTNGENLKMTHTHTYTLTNKIGSVKFIVHPSKGTHRMWEDNSTLPQHIHKILKYESTRLKHIHSISSCKALNGKNEADMKDCHTNIDNEKCKEDREKKTNEYENNMRNRRSTIEKKWQNWKSVTTSQFFSSAVGVCVCSFSISFASASFSF